MLTSDAAFELLYLLAEKDGSVLALEAVRSAKNWQKNQYERLQGETKHVWIDGPDGGNYHCVVCGHSRSGPPTDTCEEYIILEYNRIKHGNYPDCVGLSEQWKRWLNAD